MKVTRTDPLTNKVNTLELPITEAHLDKWRNGGRTIQSVMPHLSDDQREFLMTGLMPESWEEVFKDSEDASNGEDPAREIPF